MLRPHNAAVAAALLVAGMALARLSLEPEASALGKVRNPAWLPDGHILRAASFGQRLAVADLYWLRTVQYMGETLLRKADRWEALYPLTDLVTDLDPRFGYAYQVAGSNLSGVAGRLEQSYRILEKGMRNLPDRYGLPLTYATNKFFYEGDFAEAARWARRAAEVGRRPHLALLAANLSLVADSEGEYRAAAEFIEESLKQAQTPELRRELERRLVKVRTYEVLGRVERAVAGFERQHGRKPFSLFELVTGGLLLGLPQDPASGRILYDPASGEVRSSVLGPRRPLRFTAQPSTP